MSISYRPLTGWPWAVTTSRGYTRFRVGYDTTKLELLREVWYQSKNEDVIVELDVPLDSIRRDGQLRSGLKTQSPRVVVTFQDVEHGWVRYHADVYVEWRANVRCIRMTLEALRGIDRWGGSSGEQYVGFVASRALTGEVMTTIEAVEYLLEISGLELDLSPEAALADATASIHLVRQAIKAAHPDGGGSRGELVAVQQCRDILTQHHGVAV